MVRIIKYRKIWLSFTGIVILVAVLALIIWPVQLGTDFTGGSLLEVRFAGTVPTTSEISGTIDPLLEREFVVQPTDANGVILRMESLSEENHQLVLGKLREAFGQLDELRFDSIGPVIGKELAKKSIWALIIVFAAIVVYVAMAFRKVSRPVSSWKYGLITIFAGLHDALLPLGLFAVLGHFFGTEINAAFVAAILTILGYSINDTIVVMDRVRENLAKKASDSFEETLDLSINQTFARSINTTLTTLLALLAVFFFGGATVHDFALALWLVLPPALILQFSLLVRYFPFGIKKLVSWLVCFHCDE